MLWNSDGVFKDDSDDVDDVDDDDNIVDIKDIVNTIGQLNFSITSSLSSILSTRLMTWCFINDVDKDENWSVNLTFDAIFNSFFFK